MHRVANLNDDLLEGRRAKDGGGCIPIYVRCSNEPVEPAGQTFEDLRVGAKLTGSENLSDLSESRFR